MLLLPYSGILRLEPHEEFVPLLQTAGYIQSAIRGNIMEAIQKTIRPSCSLCNTEMRFVEGDVIFGDKWFHKDCAPKYRLKQH
ncbi:MAG: hypothetical protein KGI27_03515 [Thaumarchaeota archaeon]|nr:hypothetical protein [Nitrososphaerota archaeon]